MRAASAIMGIMKKRFLIIGLALPVIASALFALAQQQRPSSDETSYKFAVFGDNRPSTPDGAQPGAFRTILKRVDSFNPAFALNRF